MVLKRITDWDDAYAHSAHIPGAEGIIARWPARAAAFRDIHPPERLRYGTGARQVMDLFRPSGRAAGVAMVVHGGYWMALSGAEFSHLAGGALARGFAVAVPTYSLTPEVAIPRITVEIVAAVSAAAALIEGPVHLAGHSAGGHLVTRMVCRDVISPVLRPRLGHVLSISGVHDLRPLLRTAMAQTLRLTPEIADAESPVLQRPMDGARLTCVVGAEERPEFRRQTDLLANIWTGLGAACRSVHVPGRHHFDVIDGLTAPDGDLTSLWLDQLSV